VEVCLPGMWHGPEFGPQHLKKKKKKEKIERKSKTKKTKKKFYFGTYCSA
jgi:hypothetical protein